MFKDVLRLVRAYPQSVVGIGPHLSIWIFSIYVEAPQEKNSRQLAVCINKILQHYDMYDFSTPPTPIPSDPKPSEPGNLIPSSIQKEDYFHLFSVFGSHDDINMSLCFFQRFVQRRHDFDTYLWGVRRENSRRKRLANPRGTSKAAHDLHTPKSSQINEPNATDCQIHWLKFDIGIRPSEPMKLGSQFRSLKFARFLPISWVSSVLRVYLV